MGIVYCQTRFEFNKALARNTDLRGNAPLLNEFAKAYFNQVFFCFFFIQ